MKKSQNHGCHVMAKPTGSTCNLDCTYCFYLEKHKLYPGKSQVFMNDQTLENYIRQHIEAQPGDTVEFAWQGGEPTLAGLGFYEKASQLQKKYASGKTIQNSLQTNGILLNKVWCEFFQKNQWLIGISIDGPAELHDRYRVNRSGKPSHHKVLAAIDLLKHYKVEFNLLVVINDVNAQHPEMVYSYLKSLGTAHIQFIPLVEREISSATQNEIRLVGPNFTQQQAQVTSWSVSANDYGTFLARVFDIWVRNDIGQVYIQLFESTLATWCDYPALMCVFSEECGHAFALEANGDLYNCDHYVYPEHKLGNINQISLTEMNNDEQAIAFGKDKKSNLSADCKTCPHLKQCNGGCPKHRFLASSTGQLNHNYFCTGFKLFFGHSASYMQVMKDLLQRHRSPVELMAMIARGESTVMK